MLEFDVRVLILLTCTRKVSSKARSDQSELIVQA